MLGILIFQQVYFNLKNDCRNKVLGNIFGVDNVSISGIFIRGDVVIFRLFSDGVFYQYIFLFEDGKNQVSSTSRIVNCTMYLNDKESNSFIYQLFQCQSEYQVYQLLKHFL